MYGKLFQAQFSNSPFPPKVNKSNNPERRLACFPQTWILWAELELGSLNCQDYFFLPCTSQRKCYCASGSGGFLCVKSRQFFVHLLSTDAVSQNQLPLGSLKTLSHMIRERGCVCVCVCVCMYVCMYVLMSVYVIVCVCLCDCMCLWVYVYMCVCIFASYNSPAK